MGGFRLGRSDSGWVSSFFLGLAMVFFGGVLHREEWIGLDLKGAFFLYIEGMR